MTTKTANFTDAQTDIIAAAVREAGKGSLALATLLAADSRLNDADGNERKVRSIIAKMTRMGVPYERKAPVTKSGDPVTKKTDLVSRIAAIVSGNLDGLDKAPKPALVAIAAYVEAAAEAEAASDDETENVAS